MNNTKLFTKIIIHILAVLIIADIIWMCVMIPTWSHEEKDKNSFWASLQFMHGVAIFLAALELILKALILAYLAYDFKQKNPNDIHELWSLTYIQSMSSGQSK